MTGSCCSPSPSTPSLLPPVQNLWWTAGGGRPRFSASARRRQWLGGIRGAMQLLVDRVLHCLRTLSSTGVDRYDAACGSPVFLRYPQPSLGFQAEERLANGDGPSCLGTLAYETRTHVVPEKPHLLCSPLTHVPRPARRRQNLNGTECQNEAYQDPGAVPGNCATVPKNFVNITTTAMPPQPLSLLFNVLIPPHYVIGLAANIRAKSESWRLLIGDYETYIKANNGSGKVSNNDGTDNCNSRTAPTGYNIAAKPTPKAPMKTLNR
ncbi:hypothetical protein B0T09DRAFT_401919 [Sordaria sp. MPI-SDFR-AT-0083]|nr:hypothetical protein B0T09DRAFT_401919 [Sordaria sp. MPI-SDFR-AT-0083]